MPTMISLKNVSQKFGDLTISYPDWKVENGQHALILGTSGCGKTTLLHIISGLRKPSEGEVYVNDKNMTSLNAGELDKFRGGNIGVVFQKPHLIKALTVEQNISIAAQLSKKKIAKTRVKEVMELLGLYELRSRKTHQLSEGQAQRVSLARAVVHEPSVLAADEPTASLDDENCEKVITLLKDQATRCGAQLIIATHDQRVKNQFENHLEL